MLKANKDEMFFPVRKEMTQLFLRLTDNVLKECKTVKQQLDKSASVLNSVLDESKVHEKINENKLSYNAQLN
jgi:hypothetical protein